MNRSETASESILKLTLAHRLLVLSIKHFFFTIIVFLNIFYLFQNQFVCLFFKHQLIELKYSKQKKQLISKLVNQISVINKL